MKTWMAIVAFILVGAAVMWFVTKDQSRPAIDYEPSTNGAHVIGQAEESTDVPLLGVDAFMRNAERYGGPVRVKGVVSAADVKQELLALIDVSEFQACQTTTCAQLTLPVRWQNDMPKVAETIVVAGSVQDSGGKRIFVASGLERVAVQPKSDR